MPATTSLGFHYPVPGDAPDGPAGIQSLAADLDAYLSARRQARQVARTSTITLSNGANPVGFYDAGTPYHVGSIPYGSGIYTPSVAGIYRWDATVTFPADPDAARAEVRVLQNGSAADSGANDTSLRVGNALNLTAGGPLLVTLGDTFQIDIFYTGTSLAGVVPKLFSLTRIA